jgi:hypothetical protein
LIPSAINDVARKLEALRKRQKFDAERDKVLVKDWKGE